MGFERLVQQTAELRRWAAIDEDWLQHAVRVLTRTPEGPALGDDIAEYLRRRTRELLANPDRQMADRVTDLVQRDVYARTTQEANWNCLTDAAITGYLLRRAEEELAEHAIIAGDEAEWLRRAAQLDAKETLDGGARRLAGRLPSFFSCGESSWHRLQSWAWEHLLERSRERRKQGIEKDEPPQISGDDFDQPSSTAMRCVRSRR